MGKKFRSYAASEKLLKYILIFRLKCLKKVNGHLSKVMGKKKMCQNHGLGALKKCNNFLNKTVHVRLYVLKTTTYLWVYPPFFWRRKYHSFTGPIMVSERFSCQWAVTQTTIWFFYSEICHLRLTKYDFPQRKK